MTTVCLFDHQKYSYLLTVSDGSHQLVTVNACVTNWDTCIAPATRRPMAHHRVNPYLGARRQNETKVFSDHDETSLSIAAVSALWCEWVYVWSRVSSGAGSGMAGMAATIPIWNLVWRHHTNLLKFGQLIFRKIIKVVATRCQI